VYSTWQGVAQKDLCALGDLGERTHLAEHAENAKKEQVRQV